MSCYEITGRRRLEGVVAVQGAKNGVLPILAAALLAPGTSVIHNCPRLSDVEATLEILKELGCRAVRTGDTVEVDASALTGSAVPERLMREMRSSVIFLGALLARTGEARLCHPGGCPLGPRPIDLHLSGLRALGAQVEEAGEALCCSAGGGMTGREICLSIPSVGATENIMLAACGCRGVTRIVGAAQEPEIVDLQGFLRALGAVVEGAGTSVITICGGRPLHGGEYTVLGDRMAAATWLCAVAGCGGAVELRGAEPSHLGAVLARLKEAGCAVESAPGRIWLESRGRLGGTIPIHTAPYPGFPTDAQAVMMAALAGGRGCTMFVENMFDCRYHHVEELRHMGADIQLAGRVAVVNGRLLHGATVEGRDLRGAAALVVAALCAQGSSRVYGLNHIRRGYQDFDGTLAALGAQIRETTG